METAILVLALAGVIAADTTSGPQVLISEPLVSCSLLGVLFDMPWLGMAAGTMFQLLWLGYLPLGAARLPDGNMASYIATASLLWTSRLLEYDDKSALSLVLPTILYGIVVASIGQRMVQLVRKRNGIRNDACLKRIEAGEDISVAAVHIEGIGSSFLMGVAMTAILAPLGMLLIAGMCCFPDRISAITRVAAVLMWGTVSATAVVFFKPQENALYLILGLAGGLIWLAG